MTRLEDIQHLIRQLLPAEREALASWILDFRHTGEHVAESAPVYGAELAPRLTAEEYLKLEEESLTRHEFVGGEMFAMSGVTAAAHNLIVGNVYRAFHSRLERGPCKTFFTEFKVRLRSDRDDIFYYPDVMIACGAIDLKTRYVTDPKVIVEVLSPSTEGTDRREKLLNYRRIPALEEYILIAQAEPEVTLHRRSDRWRPVILRNAGVAAELRSLELFVPLSEIYAGALRG